MIDLKGITIDGESSKDLDDAVWVVDEGERLRLWISIAAVSNSVAPLSEPMQQALVWLESRYRGSVNSGTHR
ncbi:MAG: RNB domain-containing ribonuclease [Cyanobacteria bacterium J06555_12]